MSRFGSSTIAAVTAAGLALALSACVTPAETGDDLASRWTGQPATAFFKEFGSPFAEYGEPNGGVRYTWRKRYTLADGEGGPAVRVCEIDLLTDSADRIQRIVPTRNSKIRSDEISSCDGVLEVAGA